ncbi:MAG TPA: carboxypeptidase-like regulatory domain-containing protein [Anaerolineales bacterium]|nr:carboxypeptidase-like regulatory domain-containing protein [Anaerolineales bacterium]
MKTKALINFLLSLIVLTGLLGSSLPAQATPQACTPGPHGGTLIADETWCAGNPHIIGVVIVPAGITLTLEPGTVVKGSDPLSDLRILTGGHLEALGTPTQPITLTSVTDSGPNQWNGLNFRGGTGDLDYVTVRYGGSLSPYSGMAGNVSLLDVQGVVSIQHSRILDVGNLAGNTVHGLNVTNSHLELSDTFFSGNATQSGVGIEPDGYPMGIFGPSSVVTMTGNTFTGNLHDRVLLGDWTGDPMTANAQATLYRQAALEGYEFGTNYTIPAGMTLNVEPGVTLMSRYGQGIQVLGRIEAVGTPTQPITFTSAANTGPDQWAGLYFNGGTGELDNVTVRYGGSGINWWGNVILRNVQEGIVSIQHSRILDVGNLAGNTVHGLNVIDSHLELSDTFFSGNATQSGVGIEPDGYPMGIFGPSSVVTMTGNTFTGNLHDRVLLGDWTGDPMTANAQATLYRQAALEGYEFGTNYTIPAGMTLNVEPGVTLMSRYGQGIQVLGRIEAVGTPTQPITFTSAANTGPNQWAGLYFNGGTGRLDHVVARYGGTGFSHGANISLLNVSGEGVQISNSLITYADSPGNSPSGVRVENSIAVITSTVISDIGSENTAAALRILGSASQVQLTNVAVIRTSLPAGGGKAILVESEANLAAVHTTIAGNPGDGISVSGATAVFTNTILSKNLTGVRVENDGLVTLAQTLWDRNGTPVIGVIEETGHLEGVAGLAQDGIHLNRYSAAIGKGVVNDVVLDIDGEVRPQPAGSQPDLGADEYVSNPLEVFDTDATAFAPTWVFTTDPITGDPVTELQQDYLIRYDYGSPEANPPALNVSIEDTLPVGMNYISDTHSPDMDFTQLGGNLTWDVAQEVQKNDSGEILLHTAGTSTPGQTLTSIVTITAGADIYPLQVNTITPLVAPILLTPGTGEYCTPISGTVTLHGFAQPDVEIRVYENSSQVVTQTVTTGEFNLSYNSTHAGVDAETLLEVRACALAGDKQCSEPTAITLKQPQSFWCPQESIWEGTPTTGPLAGQHLVYGFRNDAGEFSSQNWIIPGVHGFWDTDLTLDTGYCPGTTEPPTTVWVVADGTQYDPQPGGGPVYHFDIGTAHTVTIASNCDEVVGVILIDPDGYIFDSTLGFDPEDPSAHVLPGATVTAYEYVPSSASWRPWPAHLYNDQVNPQVVGTNGYFAFFTPPGQYYLQVDAPDGYQSWRSPVVEVVNEIVHVNVPLTPLQTLAAQQILVTPSGLSLPQVTIRVGQSVLWTADDSWLAPDQYISFSEDPIQRILSELNPLENVLGFDSGRMIPGQVYIYQFAQPGTYTYADGFGHTGQVVVEAFRIFLPLVRRAPGR